MIHEIQAKVLLAYVHQPEPWFGLKYNMNIYRGCQHQCIYCDSRSECYQIENFNDVLVKVNAMQSQSHLFQPGSASGSRHPTHRPGS